MKGRNTSHAFSVAMLVVVSVAMLLPVLSCDNIGRPDHVPHYASGPARGAAIPEYTFGVFPLHNAVRLYEVYQPVVDEINSRVTAFTLRIESSRNYASYEDKLRLRKFDFAVINPYQAIVAEKLGYRIFGKMGDDSLFQGIIVVRRDSGVRSVEDLRGKAISFPAPTALAATMMTKHLLVRAGLNVDSEAEPVYVGSQDSSVMNVYRGLTLAGGTWPPTWHALKNERPDVIKELKIMWRSESLPNLALVVRDDIPKAHVSIFARVLFYLHTTEQGRSILAGMAIPRFERADSKTYDAVRTFLKEYEQLFGTLPQMEGTGK